MLRWRLAGVLALALLGQPASRASGDAAFGPLYHEFRLALDPGERTEVLGPLLSREKANTGQAFTLSPLFSWQEDSSVDRTEWDFLYPLLTSDRFGTEHRLQLMQLISLSGGRSQDASVQSKFTLFPFYFQQRSSDPKKNYTAFLPFYGHLENRVLRDEVDFVLLPLYVRTRKRDVITDNYLYPFFHRRHGDGLKGWQLWPLIGQEHKDPTRRTNSFGEAEVVAGHDKHFLLWPFYFNTKLGLGTDNPQTQRAVLPLFSVQRSPQRDSTTYLWPFGLTVTEDRERKYREWGAPWPLVVFARGEGKYANRVWPFFGHARNSVLESDFYLWPLYKFNSAKAEPLDRRRTRILFFLYSDLIEKNTTTGAALHRTDLWPLFTARRDLNGNERLQVLAPLEPLLPNNKSIERTYSPVWSLWRSERNAKTGAASQSALWNLYRRDTTPGTRKISLLFGLFQYQAGPGSKQWKLFFIPFGQGGATPRHSST